MSGRLELANQVLDALAVAWEDVLASLVERLRANWSLQQIVGSSTEVLSPPINDTIAM